MYFQAFKVPPLDFHSVVESRFLRIPNDMGYDMEMGRDSFKGPVERSDISHFMAQECKGSQRPVPLSTHPDYAFLSNQALLRVKTCEAFSCHI